jgi:apolipoprotein N-acyltransferase
MTKSFLVLFFKKEPLGFRADFAALVLGGLAALALPPFFAVPLLLVAVPGLLALIGQAKTWLGAARRGFAFGMGLHLVGLYWITDAILVRAAEFWWAVPLAVPLLAAWLSLFIAVPCALARLAGPQWRRLLVLAGFWVAGDIARQFALTGFPWNPLGSVWEFPGWLGTVFMQPAGWVGVHGLTGATLLVAGAPALRARGRAAVAALLMLWLTVGINRLHRPPLAEHDSAGAPWVVIVQGNISEQAHAANLGSYAFARASFDTHLALTREGVRRVAPGHMFFVLWPETASPFALASDAGARQAIAEAAGGAEASLVGTIRSEAGAGGELYHNSLVAVLPDGSVGGIYDKHHLVPYGEYFPSYLPIRLGEQGFTPGPGNITLHLPGLPPIGPGICYEAIFPAEVVRESDRPLLMVNITNDAWFGNSSGPRQHLAADRMRAVEEGLPLVRAANTGISAIIDAHGRVRESLPLNQAGVLTGPVPPALPPTPVSKMGLAAPLLLALGSAAVGLGLGRKTGFGRDAA